MNPWGVYSMRKLDLSEQLLFRYDGNDNIVVGDSGITLEAFARVHNKGKLTPQELTKYFGKLTLDQVYFALGWIVRNEAAIAAYLAEKRQQADKAVREAGVVPAKLSHLDRHKKALGYAL